MVVIGYMIALRRYLHRDVSRLGYKFGCSYMTFEDIEISQVLILVPRYLAGSVDMSLFPLRQVQATVYCDCVRFPLCLQQALLAIAYAS